jgi:hypothetical protein
MDTFSSDGSKLTINTGKENDNYSQLKSGVYYKKIGPKGENVVNGYDLCNCHAMWRCLESIGWVAPDGEQLRPPDRLAEFIIESPEVDAFYKDYAPTLWAAWNAGDPNAFSPMEVHDVLAWATNKWVGYDVVKFVYKASIHRQIIHEIVLENRPLVVSGRFAGLNHIVSLVGLTYDLKDTSTLVSKDDDLKRLFDARSFVGKSDYETYDNVAVLRNAIKKTKSFGDVLVYPSGIIVDDPYGECVFTSSGKSKYTPGSVGNDSRGTYGDLVTDFKELGDSSYKMAHFFTVPGAAVSS